MTRLQKKLCAILFGLCAFSAPGWADLIGTQVTGAINFGNTANYYDPAFGLVFPTAANTNGTTVTIFDPVGGNPFLFEFGSADSADVDYVDFSDSGFTVFDDVILGASAWTQTFTDAAFAGGTFNEISDNFVNGGVNASLSGDTLTLLWDGTRNTNVVNTAVYSFTPGEDAPSGTPEPSTIFLCGSAMAGLGFFTRRRA
jgi:hypothetical protein